MSQQLHHDMCHSIRCMRCGTLEQGRPAAVNSTQIMTSLKQLHHATRASKHSTSRYGLQPLLHHDFGVMQRRRQAAVSAVSKHCPDPAMSQSCTCYHRYGIPPGPPQCVLTWQKEPAGSLRTTSRLFSIAPRALFLKGGAMTSCRDS